MTSSCRACCSYRRAIPSTMFDGPESIRNGIRVAGDIKEEGRGKICPRGKNLPQERQLEVPAHQSCSGTRMCAQAILHPWQAGDSTRGAWKHVSCQRVLPTRHLSCMQRTSHHYQSGIWHGASRRLRGAVHEKFRAQARPSLPVCLCIDIATMTASRL